jgi:hypothetical protein
MASGRSIRSASEQTIALMWIRLCCPSEPTCQGASTVFHKFQDYRRSAWPSVAWPR